MAKSIIINISRGEGKDDVFKRFRMYFPVGCEWLYFSVAPVERKDRFQRINSEKCNIDLKNGPFYRR